MIACLGMSWLTLDAWGQRRLAREGAHEGHASLRRLGLEMGALQGDLKNFGRLSADSQRILFTTGLALQDAGLLRAECRGRIGLIGHFDAGCLDANAAFFRDYIDGGRTLSRANLFIYTLPSSPLAEASIFFKLTGPVLEWQCGGADLQELFDPAAACIGGGDADAMLVYRLDAGGVACWVIGRGAGEPLPARVPWMVEECIRMMRGEEK